MAFGTWMVGLIALSVLVLGSAAIAVSTEHPRGADASGHPSADTNGVPPGPPSWLDEAAPYGPSGWLNETEPLGPPEWLTLP